MDTSLKRIIAFVIDIVIISLIFKAVSVLPIDPYKEKYNETYKKYTEVIGDNKEVSDENKDEIIELNYEVYKYRTYSTVISASIFVLYFGVLQYALKGQTIGKKIMKLKVVSNSDKDDNIWLSLLNTGAVYIFKGVNFYYVTYVISMLSSLIYMMNLIMIMFRKDNRGLHDFVAGTKVVETNVTNVEIEPVEKVKKETIKEKAEKKAKKSKK